MSHLRGAVRTVGYLATTLVLGGLVGFVLMAIITPMLPGPVQPGDRHEPPIAREYVLAVMAGDAATVNRLELPKNPAMRAMTWKQFEDADALQHETLTYLGGGSVERIMTQAYVLGARDGDQYHLVPFTVTLIGDKVAYWRGGSLAGSPG